MENLPIIEFEGRRIAPKKGVYKCPFGCGDSRFSSPKWKTEKGFRKHLDNCPQSPIAITKRNDIARQKENELAVKTKDALEKSNHKIGDKINYCIETIVKGTHDSRGRRVRYEPEKRFYPATSEIKTIGYDYSLFFNGGIRERDIFETWEGASQEADARQTAWDKHVEFSRMCR